jgi:hypothetical protein
MPQNHWLLQNERTNSPLRPVMYIAATDAGVVDGEEDIVRRVDRRLGSLLKTHPVRFVENE